MLHRAGQQAEAGDSSILDLRRKAADALQALAGDSQDSSACGRRLAELAQALTDAPVGDRALLRGMSREHAAVCQALASATGQAIRVLAFGPLPRAAEGCADGAVGDWARAEDHAAAGSRVMGEGQPDSDPEWREFVPGGAIVGDTGFEAGAAGDGTVAVTQTCATVTDGASGLCLVHLFDHHFDLLAPAPAAGERSDAGETDLLDLLVGDIKTLEEQTRGTWADFRRMMSLGGVDPVPASSDFAILRDSRTQYREMIKKGEDPEHLFKRELRPRFVGLQGFLDRPLSLSMDRSPLARRALGLLKAIAVGGTAVAGTCLIAPASAAALMPAAIAAAVMSPPAAVGSTAAGVFLSSLLQSHSQARSTLTGPYAEKLKHFAQALRINTDVIILAPYYLEAAIHDRLISYLDDLARGFPTVFLSGELHQPRDVLNCPKLFAELFSMPEHWRQVCDESHFFEFVDTKDKRVILHFFWVIVSLYRLRRLVMQDTSVAVVGAKKAGKGATLNALFSVGVKSGFAQAFTTRTVESFRLEGVPYPFRVDDFPGFGDVNDISTGLTAVAYDLSAIQIVVIQFDAAQREDTVILLAQVLNRVRSLGTRFRVLFNKADQVEASTREELEQELLLHLSKINATLDLTTLSPFLTAARDAFERGGSRGQPDAAFLHTFIESDLRERILGAGDRLPTDFQLRLIVASGYLASTAGYMIAESQAAKVSEVDREPWAIPLSLDRADCAITSMRPDPLLAKRVDQNGLAASVEEVRAWLGIVLPECIFAFGGTASGHTLDRIFVPGAIEDDAAALLQGHVRRLVQRRFIRYHETPGPGTAGEHVALFRYSFVHDCKMFAPSGTAVLPRHSYWLPVEADGSGSCAAATQESTDTGDEDVSAMRRVCMQELVESRGEFRRRFRDLARLCRYQCNRLEQVARIQRLLAQAAAGVEFSITTPAARVLRSQHSWTSDPPRTSMDGSIASSPSSLMTPPQRQSPLWTPSGVSANPGPDRIAMSRAAAEMGRELVGGVDAQALLDAASGWLWVCGPVGAGDVDPDTIVVSGAGETEDELDGSHKVWCYDTRLAPFYTSLCTLFLVPLFADQVCAEELASELLSHVAGAGAGNSLPQGSGRWLADLVSNALPPALVLRAVLLRLQWATPRAHPDWQDISSAISMIDERFSSAPVECQPAPRAGAATLMGSFGDFFRRMEYGADSGIRNLSIMPDKPSEQGGAWGSDIERASPKLEQTMAEFRAFRSWIQDRLLSCGDFHLLRCSALVSDSGGDHHIGSLAEACAESINAIIFNRLWPSVLKAQFEIEDRERDKSLAQGLPVFDWTRDEAALCEYLHLPPKLWRESTSWVPGTGNGPPALRAAVDKLLSISKKTTPEGKGRVLIQTRRLVVEGVLCVQGPDSAISEDDIAPAMIYTILRAALESHCCGGADLALHADLRFIREMAWREWAAEELACADTSLGMLQWVAEARARMIAPPEQGLTSRTVHEPNAHHVLEERARAGDWEQVVRLVDVEGLAPWERSADRGGGGAVRAAVEGGHSGLALFLMLRSATAVPHGPHGNLLFSAGTHRQLQAAGSGGGGAKSAGAQELYTLRALDMLRSQDLYTARLRALDECCSTAITHAETAAAAAGFPGQPECVRGPHWRALLGNVGLNLGHAKEVLRVMLECFNSCVHERRELNGFGSLLRLGKGSELQLAIRMVEPQFEKVPEAGGHMETLEREADPVWKEFTFLVAAHPTLKGQRLLDLLTEPCQRAIRYSTEASELLKAAAAGDSAQVVGPGGLTLGTVRTAPSIEIALQLEDWISAGGGGNDGGWQCIADLPDVVRAFVNLESEARRLNKRRQERELEALAARRAQALLKGMRGMEGALERPVGVYAESPVSCSLPGRPEKEYAALLLGGNRRCLALCTDLLQPSRRTCHWSVDLSLVESVIINNGAGTAMIEAMPASIEADSTAARESLAALSLGREFGELTVTIRLAQNVSRRNEKTESSSTTDEGFKLAFSSSPALEEAGETGGGESPGSAAARGAELVLRRATGSVERGWFDLPARGLGGDNAAGGGCLTGVTSEAVPLEDFARALAAAVEAEEQKRRSLSDPRRSKLAEALLDWPQAGAS